VEAPQCQVEMWVGPVSGTIRCELEQDHTCHWHRNEGAGWEWDEGQLWPLPPRRAA
jgi:hypothetical protein